MVTYLRRRSRQRIADPSQCDHIPRIHSRRHKHHSEIARTHRGGSGGYDVTYYGEVEGHGDVEVALACAVGVPGIEEGGDDGEGVGRDGEEEGDDVAVAEGFNDGGEEVGYCAGGDEAEEEDHLEYVRSWYIREEEGQRGWYGRGVVPESTS